jgi:hypothetical protein
MTAVTHSGENPICSRTIVRSSNRLTANSLPDTAVVPIVCCGVLAAETCRRGGDLTVAAVFERCIYLRSGATFLCVGEPALGNGPLTLIADLRGQGGFSRLGLRAGQGAQASDCNIMMDTSVSFRINGCPTWRQPRWPPVPSTEELTETAASITRRAMREAPGGFARAALGVPMTTGKDELFARVARSRIARFRSWLTADATIPDDARGLPPPVRGLVGLGAGLTPSGDDFLVGSLAVLDAIGQYGPREKLVQAVALIPPGLTSDLSLCLLRTAAAGHVGEMTHRLVSSVTTGEVDAAIATAATIGHSSGWDLLAGILTTLMTVSATLTDAELAPA